MLKNLLKYLKELLASEKIGSKDKVRMMLVIAFIAVCGIGIGSSYFLGHDNRIEQISEEFVEEVIEYQLNLPENSLDIDFTPESK